MIRLDELEQKAKAATPWDAYDREKASQAWHDNKDNNAEYCRRMNPQTAMALIRVARAAMVINDSPNFVSLDMLKDLDEALKEIEA